MKARAARALGALVPALLALSACTQDGSSRARITRPAVSPRDSQAEQAVDLVKLPPAALARCLAHVQLRQACPTVAPDGVGTDGSAFGQGVHWTFTAGGGTSYADFRRDRPPDFVHLVVQGDDLSDVFETFEYLRSPVFRPQDGLMFSEERERLARLGLSGQTPRGLFLGSVTWNGKRGDLVLAPSFKYSDTIHADHLIFRWNEPGHQYAISLHAWEPFLEAVSALHTMVDSLPG